MKHAALWACSLLFFWSTSALCLPKADDLTAYKDAGTRLAALIANAQDKKDISQLKTAEVMGLVRAISDEDRILGADAIPVSDIGVILDICDVANKAIVSLALFDLKSHVDPKGSTPQIRAAVAQLMKSNSLAFQDELKELQPFLFRCLAKEIQPLTQFTSSLKPAEFTNERREGLAQARSGLAQIYAGAIQAAIDGEYREDYRIALLSVLAETSGSFVSVTELPARKKIQASAVATASKVAPPYKDHLMRIANTFENEECSGLCAVH